MFIGRTMGRERRWFLGGFVSIKMVLLYLLVAGFFIWFQIARPDLDPKYVAQQKQQTEVERQKLITFCRGGEWSGGREVPSPQCREVLHSVARP